MNLSIGNAMVMCAGYASRDESHRNSVVSRVPITVAQGRRGARDFLPANADSGTLRLTRTNHSWGVNGPEMEEISRRAGERRVRRLMGNPHGALNDQCE